MLVAVIDDGIIPEMFSIGQLRYDMIVTERGRVRPRKPNEIIATTHGTTVAGIINKYAPDAEFCSIKIFTDQTLKTTCKKLVADLKWCYKKKIPLINLSLGTTTPEDFKSVTRITEKIVCGGQTIVAACKNNGEYTLPAMLPGVLGVCTSADLVGFQYKENLEDGHCRYIASSVHELTLAHGKTMLTQVSNSYAAATITAACIVSNYELEPLV